MPFERARTIDELHALVSGADIVLSTEAPLTLALDRRVTEPRVGRLSATPRSHASGELVPQDARPLFHHLVEETDHSWKQLSRALDLALDCWEQTGTLSNLLEYPEFDTPVIREVVDLLDEFPSSYSRLASGDSPHAEDVRVIDPHSFTPLDEAILPPEYQSVDPFGDGQWSPPTFHLYPSATAIVDEVIGNITPETAERVAIVLDQSTSYSPLLEAGLDAKGVPYQGGPSFIDDNTVRNFVRLLRAAFLGKTATVADVRPLLDAAGFDTPRAVANRRLDHVEAPWSDAFERFRETIRTGTFERGLEAYLELTGAPKGVVSQLRDVLDTLGLLTRSITSERVDDLQYYLRSFEVPVDTESEGVLLTHSSSTAYVDRPVVFYLGLGQGWARSPPEYPWVDSERFVEQDLRRFKLLLQNGRQQYFLVQETMAGDEVTPCLYLDDLFDTPIERFGDIPHVVHRGRSHESKHPFDSEPAETGSRVKTVSQSTLKRLVNCPRDHYFSRLVETPTTLPMARGTALHEAAEVAVNHPELVASKRDLVVEAMCDLLQPYISDSRRAVMRTELEVGLDVIHSYLEENPPDTASYETYGPSKGENELAERLGVPVSSSLCERWFESAEVGGRGYVDLLEDRQTLVDFKSGKGRSAAEIQSKAKLDPVDAEPDFQALLYLAHHRRECPGSEIRFRFVHLLDAVDEVVKGATIPLDDLVTTITYVPATFSEFVARRAVFDQLTDYADSNDRCKVLDSLGYDRFREFFQRHELPREGEAPETRAETKAAFEALAEEVVGSYKYVSNGCALIFGDLEDVPAGYYLRGDLDAFETFLSERIDELNDYRTDRFPVAFDGEPNWDRVDNRDLILTDR